MSKNNKKRKTLSNQHANRQHKNKIRELIVIMCGLLIMASFLLYIHPDIFAPLDSKGEQFIDKHGSVIRVACNKPNQEVHVAMITNEKGMTDLSFQWVKNDLEDVSIWIIIDDVYAPFTWSTMKSPSVTSIETNEHHKSYTSKETGLIYGEGQHAAFRMDFGKNTYSIGTIRVETAPDDYLVRRQEECWLRVPCIGLWYNPKLTENTINELSDDSPEWIDRTMDGETLYYLHMEHGVTVYNPATKNKNLVLKSISPKGKDDNYHFEWNREQERFMAQIYYEDEGWKRRMEILESIAPIILGIGISCIWMVIVDITTKEE